MVSRQGPVVLIRPNAGRPRPDHLDHAMWLGEILDIHTGPLSDHEGPEPEIVPNTNPTVMP